MPKHNTLAEAIKGEKKFKVRNLPEQGINEKDKDGNSPLMAAVKVGNYKLVKALLEKEANINAVNNDGYNALDLAIIRGRGSEKKSNYKIQKLLIEKGAKITGDTEKSIAIKTSFNKFSRKKDKLKDPVSSLKDAFELERDIDEPLSSEDLDGLKKGLAKAAITPFTSNPVAVAGALGVGVKKTFQFGKSYLAKRRFKKIDRLVRNAPEAQKVQDEEKVKQNNVNHNQPEVKELTQAQKDVQLRNVASEGKDERVTFWLKNGANINAKSRNDGATPLIRAATNGHTNIVNSLIYNGANVNIQDNKGDTALIKASKVGLIYTVESLSKFSDLNIQDNKGNTALMIALENGKVAVAEMLIKAGANPNIANQLGETPIMMAASLGKEGAGLVKLLVAKGADIHQKSAENVTVLMYAAQGGDLETVKYLVDKKGADLDAKDDDGKSALDFVQDKNSEVAQFLKLNQSFFQQLIGMQANAQQKQNNVVHQDLNQAGKQKKDDQSLALLNIQPQPSAPVFEPEVVVNENRPPLNIEPIVAQPQKIQPEVAVDAEAEKQNEAEAFVKYVEDKDWYDLVADPVSFEVMEDPRILGEHTYDFSTIQDWGKQAEDGFFKITNPETREEYSFASVDSVPKNRAVLGVIKNLKEQFKQDQAQKAQEEKQQPVEQRSFSQRFKNNLVNNQKDGAFLG